MASYCPRSVSPARSGSRSIAPIVARRASRALVREARSARADPQPGDVRRVRRQHLHDGDRHRRGARRVRARGRQPGFVLAIAVWLWLTVLFANFAEAVAEGRGKAQAATLRSMRRHVHAKKLLSKQAATQYQIGRGGRAASAATSCSSRRATSFPRTARSSKASPRSTRARSRANRRRCCAKPAATSPP